MMKIFVLCLLIITLKLLLSQQIILVNGQSFGGERTRGPKEPHQQIRQLQQQSNVPQPQVPPPPPKVPPSVLASSASSLTPSTASLESASSSSSLLPSTKKSQSGASQMQPMQLTTERQMMKGSIVATALPLTTGATRGQQVPIQPQQQPIPSATSPVSSRWPYPNLGGQVNQYTGNWPPPAATVNVQPAIMNGQREDLTASARQQGWQSQAPVATGPGPSQMLPINNQQPWQAFTPPPAATAAGGSNGGSAQTPGLREGQLNYDLIKAIELAEAQKQAAWKTYDLTQCINSEPPLGGLDLPVIGAMTKQPKMCSDPVKRYYRYHSKTWSMGCCRIDTRLDSYDISKAECCLVGGSRCELNGIPCCNGASCCSGKCRMTGGFFSDQNLGLTIPYHGQPKVGRNVVPLNYAEYESCSDLRRPHYYSFSQLHEMYFGCCIRPPASSDAASELCCLLARSACDGGIACCNGAICSNGKCPIESGDLTWPSLFNVSCISPRVISQNGPPINQLPQPQQQQQQQQQQQMLRLIHDPLIQLADPIYKFFFAASLPSGQQIHAACMVQNVFPVIGEASTSKMCCLMAGSPCSPVINCCRGVPCCNGRCVKQAGSLKSRTGYSITFNECNEKD